MPADGSRRGRRHDYDHGEADRAGPLVGVGMRQASGKAGTLAGDDLVPHPGHGQRQGALLDPGKLPGRGRMRVARSEEHTSELQSPCNLVCRLLLEKKKKKSITSLFTTKTNKTNTRPT